mmetsp:Transcript_8053/g.19439  ORF Transcript_8053/g.19439 Transcript_8053/m.19439 type:complete len:281 (+) Transcript_8053:501-1343(+)|eukprot:CAMPEP_0178993170 /NCGR_PEP_ID=MMETSP0795-20121207/6553_1 /TAXON_ID=88552 /ORGANISM="Amoebophrya sp., Strain Ameob2" /LENGTH=280 /DNA_ID=CAMNT_0020685197 /DNA_START=566 /DNA_END=1408 /DNA_ORIENTATION=+
MGGGGKIGDPKDMAVGAVLQCVEAATLGMPFEVWKTRMGRFRNEGTMEAAVNVYKRGGAGAFWQGLSPKLIESATKGAILLYAKEAILLGMANANFDPTVSGIAAGAGGGVAQVSVMGPCTFLVTCVVTGDKNLSIPNKISTTWAEKGIKGFYPGGMALTFRQASNWASRQGITEFVRNKVAVIRHGDAKAKLSKWEEAGCGIMGGSLSCWNQPFEVARIQAQAAANAGEPSISMGATMGKIVRENGVGGLFQGIVPRIGLGIWQTLFMVTGAKMIKDMM